MTPHAPLAKKFAIRHARLWIGLFFLCALLLGVVTTAGYGEPWDEPAEMNILRMNLWEYTTVLGGDVSAFQALAAQERPLISQQMPTPFMPISQSVERDHGQSAYYPLFGMVMSPSLSTEQAMWLWHLYTWVLFWLGGVALYHICRHLDISRPLSCLAVLMLLLTPRFFAEGHYNNKDIVLFALVLLTLWQALRLMKRPDPLVGLAFAFTGALAANTKVVGFALWGLCGLAAMLQLALQKRLSPKTLWVALGTLLSFLFLYALLTPALWKDPAGYFAYVLENATGFARWSGYVLFRQSVFSVGMHPLPFYFLPYWMLVTLPLWIWLLVGVGQLAAGLQLLRKGPNPQRVPLALISLLWLLPLLFAVLSRTKIYNGWRHFYFLYGPMLALAAYGMHRLWQRAKARRLQRRALPALLALCMLFTGTTMALNHPYQYVYVNPLLMGKDINAFLERDYWNVSVLNALRQLADSPQVQQSPRPLTVAGVDLYTQVGTERGIAVLNSPLLHAVDGGKETPDFWLENHTYSVYSGWKPGLLRPVAQVAAYGAPLVTIYQAEPSPAETARGNNP